MSDNLNIKLNITGDVSGQEDVKKLVQSLFDLQTAYEDTKNKLRQAATLNLMDEKSAKKDLESWFRETTGMVKAVEKEKQRSTEKQARDEQRATDDRLKSQIASINKLTKETTAAQNKEEADKVKSFNSIFTARITAEKKANAAVAADEKRQLQEAKRVGVEIERSKEKEFLALFNARIKQEKVTEDRKEKEFMDSVKRRVAEQKRADDEAAKEAAQGGFINQLVTRFALVQQAISLIKSTVSEVFQIAKQIAATVYDAFLAVGAEGVRVNAEFEGIKYGLTSIINAQLQLADATSGQLLDGQEKYNAATKLAADQFYKLRIDALKVQATTEELAKNFQIGVSVGAGQGIKDLDKIRQLVVAITNAATAMNVPMDQVPVTVRAVLTGYQATHNVVARTLGLNMGLVNSWKQQGTLVEELEKRLDKFSQAAEISAKSFKVMSSNIKEAYQVLSAQMTEGLFSSLSSSMNKYFWSLFDFKNSTFTSKFDGIIQTFRQIFDEVGKYFSTIIDTVMGYIDEYNRALANNPKLLADVKLGFSDIGTAVTESTLSLMGWTKEMLKVENLPKLLKDIADGIRSITEVIGYLKTAWNSLTFVSKWATFGGLIVRSVTDIRSKWQEFSDWWDGTIDKASKTDTALGKVLATLKSIKDAESAQDVGTANRRKSGTQDAGVNRPDVDLSKIIGVSNKPPEKKEPSTFSQEVSQDRVRAEAELNMLKAVYAEKNQVLDTQYKENIISMEAYYNAKARLADELIAKEIAIKQAEIDAVKETPANTKVEILRKETDLIKLNGELAVLNFKRTSQWNDFDIKKNQDRLKLQKDINKLYEDLDKATGKSGKTNREIVSAEYAEFLKKLQAENRTADIDSLSKLIDAKTLQMDLDDLKKKYDAVMTDMGSKEAELKEKFDLGMLSTFDYEQQLMNLHRDTAGQLDDLVQKMNTLANSDLVSDEQRAKIQALIPQVNKLSNAYLEMAKTLNDSTRQAFVDLFENIRNGSMSALESVQNMVRSIVSAFGQLLSKRLGEQLFEAIMPKGGSSNSSTGWFSNFLGWIMGSGSGTNVAAASGGYISGPGTGTSDSIPARLSNGEYVIRASAVSALGVSFLDRLNGLASRPKYAFADGGLALAGGAGGSFDFNHNMEISLDEGIILRKLDSPAGTRIIAKQMDRNRKKMKQALGGSV